MVNLSSRDGHRIIVLDGNAFYVRHHRTILGNYSELFECQTDGRLSKVSRMWDYADFAGVYHGSILLRLTESSFTNYPIRLRYRLFSPNNGAYRPLPGPVEDYIHQNERAQIRAIDDILFIACGEEVLYYDSGSNAVTPVIVAPVDSAGFGDEYLFIRSGMNSYFVYGTDGHVQVLDAPQTLPEVDIRIPNTHQMYCVCDTPNGSDIYRMDLENQSAVALVASETSKIDLIMVSMDREQGYLFYRTEEQEGRSRIKRYDIFNECNDESFALPIELNDGEFISGMMAFRDRIITVVHDSSGEERVVGLVWKSDSGS